MKQTAVEWLRKELETIPSYSAFYGNNYQWIDSIMNEAKEMEKQEKHAEYMRGWKDAFIKQAPPPPLDRKIYK
jgi:hypothetical protein